MHRELQAVGLQRYMGCEWTREGKLKSEDVGETETNRYRGMHDEVVHLRAFSNK